MAAERYDLASARQAGADDRLAEWVAGFLASPGSDNEPLALALAEPSLCWFGPVSVELAALTPLAGPDPDEVVVPIDEEEWTDDVEQMQEALDEGWEPPPLIVSSHDGGLFLEDGNHRHTSLLEAGETHAWAVVCFASEADRDAFVETLARTGEAPKPVGDPEPEPLATEPA